MRKAIFALVSSLAALTSTYARPYPRAPIDDAILTKVRANAITSSQSRCIFFSLFSCFPPYLPSGLSWEIGTVTEALLEYSWPQLSVFYDGPIPPRRHLFTSNYPTDVANIATKCVTSAPVNGIPVTLVAPQGRSAEARKYLAPDAR